MQIIAHRGAWSAVEEQNTARAFTRAWGAGHGVETDLRDLDGAVVVSHDPPRSLPVPPMALEELLERWDAAGRRGRLALNIKADGLAVPVAKALADAGALERAFVFDTSVPDQLGHGRTGVAVYARTSDLEQPVLTAGVTGVWWDALRDDAWWASDAVLDHLDAGREVALVSPELHGRDHRQTWARVRSGGLHRRAGFALCTDLTDEAEEFFA